MKRERMTEEVAIDLLSMIEFEQAECCLNTWYKGIDDDMKEALEKAIKALETSDGDCISRQAVLDAFWKLDVEMRPSAINAITKMIDDIPSITPQQYKMICEVMKE